jgi:hypothetical protein
MKNFSFCRTELPSLLKGAVLAACSVWVAFRCPTALGTENVPHRPFALWAELPAKGEFVFGAVYEESEAYRIWAGHTEHNVTAHASGESYGIDINQGYLALQYGLSDRWAADLNIGATTMGYRYFSEGKVTETTGLMDYSFGVRYQILKENEGGSGWVPDLTARFGAVLPGSYEQSVAFAPGTRSAGVEPELLFRKHFGWQGFGAYGDALFRWNRTTGNDQYFTTIGLFQQIKNWELAAGYRHLQTISGQNIEFTDGDPGSLIYPRDLREINDSIEAGFSYTTPQRHIRLGFHSRTVLDGSNTDKKFWVGVSVDVPLGLWTK